MTTDRFSYHNLSLIFTEDEVESQYQQTVLRNTRKLNFAGWFIAFFLSFSFGFLDKFFFPENYQTIMIVRSLYIALTLIMIFVNSSKGIKNIQLFNSSIFILATGCFSIFLIACNNLQIFSPYFAGIFFIFTGIFFTAGFGFKHSFFSILLIVICFEVTFGIVFKLETPLFLIYNFFIFSMFLVFSFVDYLVEHLLRGNFITSSKLEESLRDVKKLSGLLPICSSCKKIRDDKGYWKELETYIQKYSDVLFSHSLCQNCAEDIYGNEKWFDKDRLKQNIKEL